MSAAAGGTQMRLPVPTVGPVWFGWEAVSVVNRAAMKAVPADNVTFIYLWIKEF